MSESKRNAQARLGDLGFKPRGFSSTEAAAYLGISAATFRSLVKKGIIPQPIPGLRRWDKKSLDAWLDGSAVSRDPILEAIRGGKG